MQKLKNIILPILLSSIGYILIVYYILNGSEDVVASDYIRIINYYLSDVHDLSLLFSWEGISRIPITFLFRIINVDIFHYSVFFDKIIGVVGLFLFNFVVLYYISKNIKNNIIKFLSSVLISIIVFSLIGWEMILNGTGYPHFLAIGLYSLIYYLYTFSFLNDNKKSIVKNLLFIIFVLLTSTLVAGPYMVAPIFTIILFSVINMLFKNSKNKLTFVSMFIITGLANYMLVFLARYKFLNDEYGMSSRYAIQYMFLIIGLILTLVLYIDNFLLVDSQNVYDNFKTNNIEKNKMDFKYIILIVACIISILLYLKSNSTGEALVPVGIKDVSLFYILTHDIYFVLSFLIKSLASSIIGVETFKYAITMGTATEKVIYGVGILYLIVIIYCLYIHIVMFLYMSGIKNIYKNRQNYKKYNFINTFKLLICSFIMISFFAGHMLTNYTEITKMPVRKYIYQNLKNIALYIENTPDEELPDIFEYHRGSDKIKNAIEILKKNKLNIFYDGKY